jgi:methyl-accepting chemotaxis protein
MSTSGQSNIDILIEQVGRMTEGITEVRLMVERVAQTTEQQAIVAAQQAESVRQQAKSANKLITMLEQRDRQ